MFFDDHPVFLTTSETAASIDRLNLRHQAIIEANRDVLAGARVLDLASHDGRWSFAALKAGAAHVTGLEGRSDLVEATQKTFADQGISRDDYEFAAGDLFESMRTGDYKADVVMCLGFMYHTLRYNELLFHIRSTGAHTLILDTTVHPRVATRFRPVRKQAVIKLKKDPSSVQANAIRDEFSVSDQVLIGVPTEKAVQLMLDAYGFTVDEAANWRKLLKAHPTKPKGVDDYARGNRITYRCVVSD